MAVPLNRRDVLKGALGVFATWTSGRLLSAQQAVGGVRRLTDQMAVVDGGGGNVLAFSTGEGFVLVDGGAPKSFDTIVASLGANAKVHTLFNTHHHVDQTGNNERFSTGTKIIAHKRTLEWMSADHWMQADDRYESARPKAARPTETFFTTGSLATGGEQIDYGHLTLAHTNGDIYVHFRNANVLAVGDVASPRRRVEVRHRDSIARRVSRDWPRTARCARLARSDHNGTRSGRRASQRGPGRTVAN